MKFKEEDVRLLLDNFYVEPGSNYSYVHVSGKLEEVISDLSVVDFTNPQVNSIRRLFIQLSPSDKEKCKNYLFDFLEPGSDIPLSKLALNALIHIGFFDQVFEKIQKNITVLANHKFHAALLREIEMIFQNEWNLFTKEQIDNSYRWVSYILNGKLVKEIRKYGSVYLDLLNLISSIWRKLNIIKTKNLKEEIFSETSQEITNDGKALRLEFTRNNFPDYLSEALDKIDLEISTAGDNFDLKNCMGLIRSFSESLFRHIAVSIDPELGDKINGMDSERAASFFMSKNLISKNQKDLLVSFRHFVSNEGVHRLKSRPDDARLSRNMLIELSLYLLLRLKDLKQ